jgi:putative transposase
MEEIMRARCADFETELVEFNGENNHVHLLANFPPEIAIAKLVNSLKGVSLRRMRQELPDSYATTTGPTTSGRPRTSQAPPVTSR